MNAEDKIKAIYKKIANKELSFGCKILTDSNTMYYIPIKFLHGKDSNGKFIQTKNDFHYIKKIIGCHVMLGDVLDYLEKKYFKFLTSKEIGTAGFNKPGIPYGIKKIDLFNIMDIAKFYGIWNEKRKPIDDQSDECIDFIYNLIKE